MADTLLSIRHLTKSFSVGREKNIVLSNINFNIEKGRFISIIGPCKCYSISEPFKAQTLTKK